MKTVAILGGLDFLGCDVTLKFLSENFLVKVLDFSRHENNHALIKTGLKSSDCLQIHSIDFKNTLQFTSLIKDCDCLIHCGMPFKLNLKNQKEPVFVPLIKDTDNLLKAVVKAPRIGKVIFLSAAVDLYETYNGAFSDSVSKNKKVQKSNTTGFKKALYHSDKIINGILADFPQSRIEVFFVSPVTVSNNTMTNNKASVMEGLKYLFHNKINHDKTFLNLIKRNPVTTMLDVNRIPDTLFTCINEMNGIKERSPFLSYRSDLI